MGSGRWGWIVPDGLWEIARPLLPPARVRPQGGGVANIDDEAVFSCFPKDSRALRAMASNSGYSFQMLSSVIEVNDLQPRRAIQG
jgi:hypothetical protein